MSDPNDKQKCGGSLLKLNTLTTRQVADMALAEAPREGATAPLDGSAAEAKPDTGHAEADRVIGRLASSDPDFDDCTDAAVLIRQLVVEHRGPDGFATWKDAAVAERLKARDAASRVAELEAGIRQWASECGGCNFGQGATGVVEVDGVEKPCDQCADIRALLPSAALPKGAQP